MIKIKKFPVYINDKEYRISLRRRYFPESYQEKDWIVKIYKPGKRVRCYCTCIEDKPSFGDRIDYIWVAKEAVREFEKKLRTMEIDESELERFRKWDGK